MAEYPIEVTVKFKVFKDGKIDILEKSGIEVTKALSAGKSITGHNAIGVLVSNPTPQICFIVNGKMYCY